MDIEYKGKTISFDSRDEKFYISGSDKTFSSVATAKKAIDKAVPEKAFVSFNLVRADSVNGYAAPDKPEVVTIVGASLVKGRRRNYNDSVHFQLKVEGSDTVETVNPRWNGNFYPMDMLPELMTDWEKAVELHTKKEAIDNELEEMAKNRSNRVNVEHESLDMGNEEPKNI